MQWTKVSTECTLWMEGTLRIPFALCSPSGVGSGMGRLVSSAWSETEVMTELGVVLSFLIPFQLLTCMGAIRYTFPVSTSCVSSAHKLTVICPVVSANVLSISLRFFAPTTVGSARWRALPKKVINSQSLEDCFICSTVHVGCKLSADGRSCFITRWRVFYKCVQLVQGEIGLLWDLKSPKVALSRLKSP